MCFQFRVLLPKILKNQKPIRKELWALEWGIECPPAPSRTYKKSVTGPTNGGTMTQNWVWVQGSWNMVPWKQASVNQQNKTKTLLKTSLSKWYLLERKLTIWAWHNKQKGGGVEDPSLSRTRGARSEERRNPNERQNCQKTLVGVFKADLNEIIKKCWDLNKFFFF